MKFRKMTAFLAAMAMMCGSVSVPVFAESTAIEESAEQTDIDKDGEYLKVYFDVAFSGEDVTAAEFDANLAKAVFGEQTTATEATDVYKRQVQLCMYIILLLLHRENRCLENQKRRF